MDDIKLEEVMEDFQQELLQIKGLLLTLRREHNELKENLDKANKSLENISKTVVQEYVN